MMDLQRIAGILTIVEADPGIFCTDEGEAIDNELAAIGQEAVWDNETDEWLVRPIEQDGDEPYSRR